MSTKFWKVMCFEHGIGGDGEYCCDSDAQLDRAKIKYVSRALPCDLEPGVIGAPRASPLSEFFFPENLAN
jgi:tubulin beta